jgi:hypothetical protein
MTKMGTVFGNRERLLPREQRGYYREYTVETPGERVTVVRSRIVCGGQRLEHARCLLLQRAITIQASGRSYAMMAFEQFQPSLLATSRRVLRLLTSVDAAEDTTPYECDGLTAYRQQPLVVALPETEAQVQACCGLPRSGAGGGARRRHRPVGRRACRTRWA